MQQDSSSIYYMVVDEKSTGPYTLDEITLHPALTPETLVWKPGIDNWIAAKTLPELAPAFVNQQEQNQYQTPPEYKNPPFSGEENQNNQFQNPNQGHYHHPNQEPYNRDYYSQGRNQYGNQGEPNPFANNPQYQSNHTYHNQNRYYDRYDSRYQNGFRPNMRTNWLPWAIVATILGFFASCIGAIFGIIGIVQANKANTLYAQGFDREGDAANSNAKIMTIIGLIFAAIGIIAVLWFGSTFSTISNLSYF